MMINDKPMSDNNQKNAGRDNTPQPQQQQQTQKSSSFIEIPVKHLNSNVDPNFNTGASPFNNTPFNNNSPFNKPSLIRDRSPFNQPFSNTTRQRQPVFSNKSFFDGPSLFNSGFDDFDNFGMKNSIFDDRNFGNFDSLRSKLDSRMPPFQSYFTSPNQPQSNAQQHQQESPAQKQTPVNNSPRATPPKEQQQQQQQQQQPQQQYTEPVKEPSPIPVNHINPVNEAQKRYKSETVIHPNQTIITEPIINSLNTASTAPIATNSSNNNPIPIKINHIPSTNKSDFKYTDTKQSSPILTDSKMGSTMSQNAPKQKPNQATSDFLSGQTKPTSQAQSQQQPQPQVNKTQEKAAKTEQDKYESVKKELEDLEKEIEKFNGRKTDKQFLKIDEMLTRCLIKLDSIEKGDDLVLKQNIKNLINFTHTLGGNLEKRCKNQTDCDNIDVVKQTEETAQVSSQETSEQQQQQQQQQQKQKQQKEELNSNTQTNTNESNSQPSEN